ncbi:MAG: lipopolysaccharide biosynthesis [Pseudolabrys sp.]|jgi:uncharacterized protein involved in exopolysaccharide biosynthesis/Mrp family chromosome partitioning ATPase|nr:lipopolysaccharide biosynthesis [Pseudolabrys sp.]
MFFSWKSKDKKAQPDTTEPPPVSQAPSQPILSNLTGEPDFRALGAALWRKKTRIIAFTALVAAAAIVVVNMITPRYSSETRVLLEARQNVFLRAEADKQIERTPVDAETVLSQTQVISSRNLAREVIKKEGLTQKPEFNSGASIFRTLLGMIGIGRNPSTMTVEERTLEAYYNHLDVNVVDKSRVISIVFSSADPNLAASVANTIASTYLTMQQAAQQQQTREASQWLAGEIGNMRAKVADAESKIEEYRAKQNLYGGTNNSSLPSQQLTEINSQIATARGQEADLEARAKQLRALLKSGRSIDASDIANSETMRRLTEQRVALRAQLAEQSSTLLDQHPRIKELRAQIAELDSQIRAEGERLARQLENDAKVASDRVASLQRSLDEVKKLASRTNEQDVELRALEREAKTQRDLLESYLAKYREAVARDNINAAPPEARIISTASAAIKPAYPRKLPIVLIAALAALTLSAGFTVTSEMLSPGASYAYPYPAAPYMTAPSLAPAMPAVAAASPPFVSPVPPVQPMQAPPGAPVEPHVPMYRPSVVQAHAPLSVSTMDQITGWIRQSGAAGGRVAVVGSERNVGTTYAAITLARSLAQQSSVVLIDLAFSAPNLSVLSTDPNVPGIAELLRGTASFGEVITRDQFSNVHVIATGDVAGEGMALVSAPMLPAAVEALTQSYDFVVIDAGAIAETAPEHIAALTGCAVLVTGDAANAGARSARERMAAAGFGEVAVLVGGAAMAAA